jgi:hypothetical protein
VNTADWILDHKGYYTMDYTCFCIHLKGNLTKNVYLDQNNIEKEVPWKDKTQGVCTIHFCSVVYIF